MQNNKNLYISIFIITAFIILSMLYFLGESARIEHIRGIYPYIDSYVTCILISFLIIYISMNLEWKRNEKIGKKFSFAYGVQLFFIGIFFLIFLYIDHTSFFMTRNPGAFFTSHDSAMLIGYMFTWVCFVYLFSMIGVWINRAIASKYLKKW